MRYRFVAIVLPAVLAASACGPDDGQSGDDGGQPCPPGVPAGSYRCSGFEWQRCVRGAWAPAEDCRASGRTCAEVLGCVSCYPGRTFCDGLDVRTCNPDGESSTVTRTCDADAGEACEPGAGTCVGLCAEARRNRSNIGCEYWAVDLDNAENFVDIAAYAQFAVAVANLTTSYTAEVTVEIDEGVPGGEHLPRVLESVPLGPGDLHVFDLPHWDVDGDSSGGRDDDPQTTLTRRVYRISSTIPVVAYQFNPIDQAFSNGSSLLLPTSGLDNEHHVVVWPPANPLPDPMLLPFPNRNYVTVVGVEDGTTVMVTPTYDIFEGVGDPPIPSIPAGTTAEFRLDRFDVLNLETRGMRGLRDAIPDLTGTKVLSSAPVAVFTGVDLAVVGDASRAPPDGGGQFCCAEHLESQVPPVEQRRGTYIFTTGRGFAENWAVVSMPLGSAATIDGADVASTCGAPRTDGEMDGLTYVSYFCRIADGRHEVVGEDGEVGVIVYGYYNAGSYGYPAGSDLERIFFG
ncbi:MAG: IgGFc-binding protein [Myxococcota bacterium]|nr:IgGFc-binding protein [Myxococcota bacterium]